MEIVRNVSLAKCERGSLGRQLLHLLTKLVFRIFNISSKKGTWPSLKEITKFSPNMLRRERERLFMMTCSIPFLAVNGNWTVWSGWYWCSSICGPGRQERYRYCVNPKPANGGAPCAGLANESRVCENEPCPSEYMHI